MSIKDMITDIEQEVREEIEAAKNRAKTETTKSLVAKADQWEAFYQEKKDKLRVQLERRELSLKAEKDFTFRNQQLILEDQFAETLVPFMKEVLLNFPVENPEEYQTIISRWLEEAASALEGPELTVRMNPRDKKAAARYKERPLLVKEDPSIEAGFILSNNQGVYVDLSFAALYTEHQNRLQSIVMGHLKESVR